MARERYLKDSAEDTIHDRSYLDKMSKEEKRRNWWDYNKWYVVIGVIAAVMIVYYLIAYITRVEPDYYVAMLTQVSVEDAALTDLADHLEQYGEDVNGDGEVKIEVVLYANDGVPVEDASYLESVEMFHSKYIADFDSCTCMIWITDETSYEMIGEQVDDVFAKVDSAYADEECDRWVPIDTLTSMDNIAFPNIQGYDHDFTEADLNKLLDRYNLSIRMRGGSKIDMDANLINYHKASQKLFDNLVNDTKIVEG